MATAVDLGGVTYPAQKDGNKLIPLEGISLKPALNGRPLERGKPIFWEHEGNRAVRDGQWKLVAKGVKSSWELYDMDRDRTEMHDLAGSKPDRASRMAAQYDQWAKERGVVPFGSWKKGKKKK